MFPLNSVCYYFSKDQIVRNAVKGLKSSKSLNTVSTICIIWKSNDLFVNLRSITDLPCFKKQVSEWTKFSESKELQKQGR